MFELITGGSLILLLIAGSISLWKAIINTNISADIDDAKVNTHKDIALLTELKKVVIKRADAEKITQLGSQVVQIKRCDENIIDLAERIKAANICA